MSITAAVRGALDDLFTAAVYGPLDDLITAGVMPAHVNQSDSREVWCIGRPIHRSCRGAREPIGLARGMVHWTTYSPQLSRRT